MVDCQSPPVEAMDINPGSEHESGKVPLRWTMGHEGTATVATAATADEGALPGRVVLSREDTDGGTPRVTLSRDVTDEGTTRVLHPRQDHAPLALAQAQSEKFVNPPAPTKQARRPEEGRRQGKRISPAGCVGGTPYLSSEGRLKGSRGGRLPQKVTRSWRPESSGRSWGSADRTSRIQRLTSRRGCNHCSAPNAGHQVSGLGTGWTRMCMVR